MDIKTDYVRSLSSASFVLEIKFESNAGKSAVMHLAVSGGVCFSADGDMKADVIYLYPKQERNDITVGDKSIYSAKDLDELCDLLFDAATIEGWQDPNVDYNAYRAKVNGLTFAIDGRLKCYGSHKELAGRIEQLGGMVSASISSDVDYLICNDPKAVSRKASKARQLDIPFISDFDFMWGSFAKNPCCEDQENRRDDGITASVTAVAPITIANFKYACADAGITLENLMTIMIRNNKFGNRDSAMFILSENDKFEEYRKMYMNTPDGQKRSIAEDFIAFVKAGPILAVNDNEFELPETMCCVWDGSDEALEKEMQAYLEGGGPGYWMGKYSMEFTINVAERTATSREVFFYGEI